MARVGVGVALGGLAIAGFFLFVVTQVPSESLLAQLAVPGPAAHLPGQPHGRAEPASRSRLASLRRAAAATPGGTGSYAVRWNGNKARAATLELYVLPSGPDALAALRAAEGASLAQSSLTAVGFGYAGILQVPGVPGARGASYVSGTSPTVTPSAPHLDVAVFRVDRVVVVARAAGATAGEARANLLRMARAERRHVLLAGARPSIARVSVPPLAAAAYLVVAALVVAAAVGSPAIVATVRRRRLAAREEAVRRERAARGRKVVKRRGSPAPAGRSRPRR